MRSPIIFGFGLVLCFVLAWWWPRGGSPDQPDTVEAVPSTEQAPSEQVADLRAPEASSRPKRRLAVALTQECHLRIRVMEEGTAEPINGLTCEIAPGDGRTPFGFRVVGATRRDGEVRVRDLAPGWYEVRVAGSHDATRANVKPGSNTAVIEVPRATRVIGRVVGRTESILSGAEIWLSGRELAGQERQVATSDNNGQFHFEARGIDRLVTARIPGTGCSLSVPLNQPSLESAEVVLVVDQASSNIIGRVRDAQGEPVNGARVMVGTLDRIARYAIRGAPYGSPRSPRLPSDVVTDASGHFEASTAPIGDRVQVCVRAIGLAPWKGQVRAVPSETTFIDVRLQEGTIVQGTVTDSDGAACPGAVVSVAARHNEPHWFSTEAASSLDGSFVLPGLAPGDIHVRARDHRRGRADEQLEGQSGQTLTWNPTLDPGRRIFGRVVDEDGLPLVAWTVEAADGKRRGRVQTDARGEFRILHCGAGVHELTAYQPGAWMPTRVAAVKDVLPDSRPVEIRILNADLASTYIKGQVLRADGSPGRSVASIRVNTAALSQQMSMDLKPGPFSLGPLRPGEYQVDISLHGHDLLSIEPFELAASEIRNLGVLQATAAGELVLRAFAADGGLLESGHVYLRTPDGKVVADTAVENGTATLEVRAGRYEAFVWAPGHAFSQEYVVVPAGGSTESTTHLNKGLEWRFQLTGESRRAPVSPVLVWRTPEKGVFARERVRMALDESGSFVFKRTLQPGRYVLEFTSLNYAADAEFTVSPGQTENRVDLQMRSISREERTKRWR